MPETSSQSIANTASLSANEAERLEALRRYNILDTPPELAFDRITSLAARLFDVPTALVSLVDESRAWFKSCYGFDQQEVSRDDTICSFALLYNGVFVVPNVQQDDRFSCSPFVQSEPGFRFYAGAPLLTSDGFNLGTLCLFDSKPRTTFTDEQKATLADLAAMVVDELELRLAARKIAQVDAALLEVSQGVSAVTGKAFFHALVQHLTKALGVNYACISLLTSKNPAAVKTLAFCAQGELIDNVEYELQDTPCLEVIRQQKLGCYPSNLQALFPNDLFLVSRGIESYASTPFFDSQGNLLGLLGVMDNKPLENVQLVESLLTLFAMRIAAELERQQAEEMQQAATQRLQLYADVVRNAQVGIVVWQLENLNDPGSFRLVIANSAASEATGFDFEAAIGKTIAESFPNLLHTPLAQQYLEVVCTGQSFDLGEVFYSEDGISTGIYSLKVFPLPDQCFGLAFENITVRQQLETQLKESQHYSQQIAEAMPGVLFVHDIIEQKNVYANRQITDLLGYTFEQVQEMGENALATLIHPDDLERVIAYFEAFRSISDGTIVGIEYRGHHANGEWRWLYTQSVVFNRTTDGSPCQVLGVSIDISDRKQAEALLIEQEQRYRYIFEAVGVAIWEEDFSEAKAAIDQLKATGIQDFRQYFADHPEFVQQVVHLVRIQDVNQAALQMFGAQEKTELLSSLEQIFVPETQSTFVEELLAIANEETFFAAETVLQTLQGSRLNVWFTITFPPASESYDHVLVSLLDITQRKQVETALQASEERLSLALRSAKAGIWQWFKADNRSIWSDENFELMGYAPGQVSPSYETWMQVVHPEDREMAEQAVQQALNENSSLYFEYRICLPDGSVRWLADIGQITYDQEGNQDGMIGLQVNISKRKRSELERARIETELRQSEERLSLALKATNQGLYDLNIQTGEAIVSPEYARMLGYEPEEFQETNAKWRDRMHPDDVATVYRVYEEYIAGVHNEYRVEFRQRTKAGGWVWVLSIGKIVTWDEDGNPLRMLGTHTDISDRIQAEQALQQHSERLNLLYETTSDLLSAKHPLDLMNRLFDRLSDLMDLHYYYHFKLIEQEGQPRLQLMNYSGLSEEQAQSFETLELGQAMCGLVAQERHQIVLDQNGISSHPNARIICSMGVSSYAGQPLMVHGRLLGTLSFASLTRSEFTPEEIYLLHAISEQVAIALDRAELVASLQQQTEDLAQANRVKDEFLAVLSHELRSPLNPILGWTKLLQTGNYDAERTKQALNIIERNAKQQTQLIDDLLDISKILQGKLALNEAPVDLMLTIEAALETVRLSAEAKDIHIKTDFDASLAPVLGDEGRLQQIVLNLLSNAIKFTPNGGQIAVCLQRVESQAQIQVKDTGKGITPEFLPYVFESFRQEDGKTTRKFGGLGLGLAIVRQLTELHGGRVRAESMGEGTGATFTVCLPLMKTLSLRSDTSPQDDVSFNEANVLRGIRVLVVDDEKDMRDLVVTILEQAGAIVQTAASAVEAIAAFERSQPALLISDIGMPDLDGYMLIQRLRALPSQQERQTPAIALTAYAGEFDQRRALQAGFQKHISKPIEPQVLIKAIVELVGFRAGQKTPSFPTRETTTSDKATIPPTSI
ncbi:MAG TPA: PAS domain-containing protein [Leptolyngbyaceae cyanobacterium]